MKHIITKQIIVIIMILSLFLSGCQQLKGVLYTKTPAAAPVMKNTPASPETPTLQSCQASSECNGKQCIDNTCQILTDLYQTDCPVKCSFSSITFSTSDGETYTLAEGQGTYTAAGALEWKVASVPDFCNKEGLVVPLLLVKKNYGKVVAEEVVTLKEGQTSKIITHPTIQRVKFTVKADKVETSCK